MTPREFEFLGRILKEYSGLKLSPEKQPLLESRLVKLLKENGLPNVSALCAAMLRPDGESLRWRLAEAMAVQETYFFRDKAIFACFEEKILPALLEKRAASKRLRIWCAAAATGQEPYSVAMILADKAQLLAGWDIEILATDFSEEALVKARKGLYSQFEVQRGLPVTLLLKHFRQAEKGWEIDPSLRAMVEFRQQNLLHNSRRHGVFDAIFCRNVLIYFDEATKRAVLARLTEQVAEGGYLLLGATESVLGLSEALAPLPEPSPGVYRLSGDGRQAAGTGSIASLSPTGEFPSAATGDAPALRQIYAVR